MYFRISALLMCIIAVHAIRYKTPYYCMTADNYCPNPLQKKITYDNVVMYDFANIKIKLIDKIFIIENQKSEIQCITYDHDSVTNHALYCPEKVIIITNRKCDKTVTLQCNYFETIQELFFY